MASILYAWEFGSAFGHVGAFLPLGERLRARGHDVRMALPQIDSAAALLRKHGFEWLQSPTIPEQPRPGPPLSYADILLRFGYASVDTLLGLVVAWRELIKLTRSELVLPDHAPTAILAARTLGIPILTFSYGFCVPPPVSPSPNMRSWIHIDPTHLEKSERLALTAINEVLARFERPRLQSVAELFGVDEPSLMTFPELDHYADQRGPTTYWGCLVSSVSSAPPPWPPCSGKRIFAYLRSDIRHAGAVLAAIVRSGQPSVVVFPDMPNELRAHCAHPNIALSSVPLDTVRVLAETDLAITYGGHGLTAAFLLAGKPLLVLPGQLEQYMLARRVENLGAGLLVDPEQPSGDLLSKIQRLTGDPGFAQNARAFASRYAGFSQETILSNLTRRIEELAAAPIYPGVHP